MLAGASFAVPTREQAPPDGAASHPQSGLSPAERARMLYDRARSHGSPIAVLTRETVLRAAPRGRPIVGLSLWTDFGSPRVLAAVGERHGWLRVIVSEVANGRRGWIPASAARIASDRWRIEASLGSKEVTVLRDGQVVRRFTVAIGSSSTPTPTGRFAVTDKIHMKGASPYGCCVLALTGHQPHIAQGWSGGDRLAIHATDSPSTVGRAASLGCLRARDADARWLIGHVYLGTIVDIRP